MSKKLGSLGLVAGLAFAAAGARAELALPSLPTMAFVKETLAKTADEVGHVWMHIRPGPGAGTYNMDDPFLRVRLDASVRDGEFDFDGWVGDGWFDLRGQPIWQGRKDYSLSGGFGNRLDLRQFGGFGKDYVLSGEVRGADNKTYRVYVNFRYNEYNKSYDIAGEGLGLRLETFSSYEINGSVDFRRCPREGLAAVAAASTIIIHNDRPGREKEDKPEKGGKK